MKTKWLYLTGMVTLTIGLAACGTDGSGGGTESPDSEQTFTIGATQIVEHASLDEAYEGFQQAIEDAGLNVTYDFQNAQNDTTNASTIANNFISSQVDLIFANSTPSALSSLQASDDTPIIFTSVSDPVGAGLVEELDQPGDVITGVTDLHPEAIDLTIDFIAKYFEGAAIGTIYNAGEANSVAQLEAIEAAMEPTDLELVTRSVSSSAEVQQAASSLTGEIDVLYIFTDNTVVSALPTVVSEANNQQIPLFVGEPNSLAEGGFATYGSEFFDLGYRAGEMAVEVLTGEKTTADIPVEYPGDIHLMINKEAAENQGVEWNDEWDDIAEFYEGE